jgi:DNA-binding MltR family transcriptional regulator
MASRPRRSNYIKKLAKEIPEDKQIKQILYKLDLEDTPLADYAIAMIGATLVAGALEAAILAICRPLDQEERSRLFSFEQRGPLADLGARIQTAYALKLVGPVTRDDLNSINLIRNAFAHHPVLRMFAEPSIANQCNELSFVKTLTLAETGGLPDARSRYAASCRTIASRLKREITAQIVARALSNRWDNLYELP